MEILELYLIEERAKMAQNINLKSLFPVSFAAGTLVDVRN